MVHLYMASSPFVVRIGAFCSDESEFFGYERSRCSTYCIVLYCCDWRESSGWNVRMENEVFPKLPRRCARGTTTFQRLLRPMSTTDYYPQCGRFMPGGGLFLLMGLKRIRVGGRSSRAVVHAYPLQACHVKVSGTPLLTVAACTEVFRTP